MSTEFTLTATFTADESHHAFDPSSLSTSIATILRDEYGTDGRYLHGFAEESATIDPESIRVRLVGGQHPTPEQIADSFVNVGHALDWEDGVKRRAYLIQAVRIARGEV